MVKLLEDSVGTYGNILMALTFIGVLYLVLKQAKINVQVNRSGFNGIRFKTVADGRNHIGSTNYY